MAREKKHALPDWQKEMNHFFHSPLAERAAAGLSERASILLHVDGKPFLFRRKKGKNTLSEAGKESADVDFWVPLSAMRHLLEKAQQPGADLGTMGVAVLEQLFAKQDEKIKFRVNIGFLGLWSKGYFSVLKAGGPEVASSMARFGFNSLSRIKEVLRNIRG